MEVNSYKIIKRHIEGASSRKYRGRFHVIKDIKGDQSELKMS